MAGTRFCGIPGQKLRSRFVCPEEEDNKRESGSGEARGGGNSYWVEHRAHAVGSILGWGSLKFGVYQRSENKPQRQGYVNDGDYTWMRGFGSTREEAFVNVKSEILKIIQASSCGNFREIDELILPDLFKWKVAFLYSNERLIPVFSREILEGAAAWLEFKADAYAANCFRAALGQLLAYAYGRKVKKIVVVGQNRPTAAEREMIRHLQEKVLRVAFDYEQAAAV